MAILRSLVPSLWLFSLVLWLQFFSTAFAVTGDSACGRYLCVNATVIDDMVTYELTPLTRRAEMGWIALGFGRHMMGSHMVIMWDNEDGSTTLSQRYASSHMEPKVVDTPPRIATLTTPKLPAFLEDTVNHRYTFEIPLNRSFFDEGSDLAERVIWAFSINKPKSSEVDTHLAQHFSAGSLQLRLMNELSSDVSIILPGDASEDLNRPYNTHERLVIGHAFFISLGFLVLLPTGSLLARWARTFTPKWFIAHRLVNFYVALPLILLGWVLGPIAVFDAQAGHLMDPHKICGFILLFMYLAQLYLGKYIHDRKDRKKTAHPPSNILHATVGISLISMAFFQVRSGFDEWQSATGLDPQVWWSTLWKMWAMVVAVAYLVGLVLLRRQFHQEAEGLFPSSVPKHYIALSPESGSLLFDASARQSGTFEHVVGNASSDSLDHTKEGDAVSIPLLQKENV